MSCLNKTSQEGGWKKLLANGVSLFFLNDLILVQPLPLSQDLRLMDEVGLGEGLREGAQGGPQREGG